VWLGERCCLSLNEIPRGNGADAGGLIRYGIDLIIAIDAVSRCALLRVGSRSQSVASAIPFCVTFAAADARLFAERRMIIG
jgi:hypothetical protein